MAEAKLYGQNKGGMSINGIIKDYYVYAGEDISAGDLVEYVNGVAGRTWYGTNVDTDLSQNATYSGQSISAVTLDENRVFIAHSYGSSYYLYGVVCTINGATITYGTDTELNSYASAGAQISAVKLQDGRVFIAHSYSGNYYLYGMIVSINGTAVTKEADTELSSVDYTGYRISARLLPTGKIFIAHCYSSSYYIHGKVISINDTTITAGTGTALAATKDAGQVIDTTVLDNGNVFIAHSYTSDLFLNGVVCSIDDTTITPGEDVVLLQEKNASFCSIETLRNGRVFIAHKDSNYDIYGMICNITELTITKRTDTLIANLLTPARIGTIATNYIYTEVFDKECVFVVYPGDTKYSMYAHTVEINGDTITEAWFTTYELDDVNNLALSLSTTILHHGIIFIAHPYGDLNYLYGLLTSVVYDIKNDKHDINNIPGHVFAFDYETQVRKVTTEQFDGVAKTSGIGGNDTGHNDLVRIWTKE